MNWKTSLHTLFNYWGSWRNGYMRAVHVWRPNVVNGCCCVCPCNGGPWCLTNQSSWWLTNMHTRLVKAEAG